MRKLFTFIVLTYNHEEFICDHLSSIKYQITNYGLDYDFQLIIGDDSSTDSTLMKVTNWLEKNNVLFSSVDLLVNESNIGTSKSLINCFKKIRGDYFKCTAGDDIYSNNNLFEVMKYLDEYDIVSTFAMPFFRDGVHYSKSLDKQLFYLNRYGKRNYKSLRKTFTTPMMTPGLFYKKTLITESVMDVMKNCVLIEDRAMHIGFFIENPILKINILPEIYVLYRQHDDSVMHTTNSNIKKVLKKDKKYLNTKIISNSHNMLFKLRFLVRCFVQNNDSIKIINYASIGAITNNLAFIFSKKKDRVQISNYLKKEADYNQQYYKKAIRNMDSVNYEKY